MVAVFLILFILFSTHPYFGEFSGGDIFHGQSLPVRVCARFARPLYISLEDGPTDKPACL